MTANQILEIVNNLRLLNQLAVFIYLGHFILNGMPRNSKPQDMILPDHRRMATSLALAIETWLLGSVIVGMTVWVNRAMGVGGGLSHHLPFWIIIGMTAGSLLMVFGALLVLRIMSIARHGDLFWYLMIFADIIYLIWAIIVR